MRGVGLRSSVRGVIAFRGLVTGWLAKMLRRGRREEVGLAAAVPDNGWSRGRLLARRELPGGSGVGRAWATCSLSAVA